MSHPTHSCHRRVLSRGPYGELALCDCPVLHLSIGPVTVRLDRDGARAVQEMLATGLGSWVDPGASLARPPTAATDEPAGQEPFPPPPHDPRERETRITCDGWEVRAFAADDPRTGYFGARGFLHLQLWHPLARVSVLTPSRLTRDAFEVCSADTPKARYERYQELEAHLEQQHRVSPPDAGVLLALERLFLQLPRGSKAEASTQAPARG